MRKEVNEDEARRQGWVSEYMGKHNVAYTLKFIDPSYIIRSVPANANDRIYCGFLGQHAVHAAMAGKTGMVVSYLRGHYIHLPLALVAGERRRIDVNSDYWRAVMESTGQLTYRASPEHPEVCPAGAEATRP